MKTKSSSVLSNSFPILLLIFLAAAASVPQIAMSAEQPEQAAPAAQEATVQIVYLDRPADADPEEFHIRTLAPVLGRYTRGIWIPRLVVSTICAIYVAPVVGVWIPVVRLR